MSEIGVHLNRDDCEAQIAADLQRAGIEGTEARIAVLMATRGHSRPEFELIKILTGYTGLLDPAKNHQAISSLRVRGWLVEHKSYDAILVSQAPDLRDKIAAQTGKPEYSDLLSDLRKIRSDVVLVIGSMSDRDAYAGFHERINGATRSIVLPMLATTPDLAAAELLKERAKAGVNVRILLASARVVSKLRGSSQKQSAKLAIEGWKQHAVGLPNMEIRVSSYVADCYAATSMMVDDRILRFDVYDPHKQRTLEGELFEIISPDGYDINAIRLYRLYINRAWSRAVPTNYGAIPMWFMLHIRYLLVALPFIVLCFYIDPSQPAFAVLTSIAAGLITCQILQVINSG